MHRKLLTYFIYISFIATTVACSSAKSAYEEGDYYTAVLKSVKRLRKNPDHMTSQEVLHKAYPLAVKHYKDRAKHLESSIDPFKYGKVLSCYASLNDLYQEIQTCPGAMKVIHHPKSFHKEANKYRELAAEERYLAADQAMAMGSREQAKKAYFLYKDAQKYIFNYKDTDTKTVEAKEAATLNVLYKQELGSGVRYNHKDELRSFQYDMNNYFSSYNKNEFVRFYKNAQDCSGTLYQRATISVMDIDFGSLESSQKTVEVESDSVVVGEYKTKDGIKKKVYGIVKAQVTTYKRSMDCDAKVNFKVTDLLEGRIVRSQQFNETYTWEYQWASYKGDERALTSKQKALVKVPAPKFRRPNEDDLIREVMQDIAPKVKNEVNRYYKQF